MANEDKIELERLIQAFDNLDAPIRDMVVVLSQTHLEIKQLRRIILLLLLLTALLMATLVFTTYRATETADRLTRVQTEVSQQKVVSKVVVKALTEEFPGRPELDKIQKVTTSTVGAK